MRAICSGLMRSLRDRPEPLSVTRPASSMPCCANQRRTLRSARSAVVSGKAAAPGAAASATPSSRNNTRAKALSDALFKGRSSSPQGRLVWRARTLASGAEALSETPSRTPPSHVPPRPRHRLRKRRSASSSRSMSCSAARSVQPRGKAPLSVIRVGVRVGVRGAVRAPPLSVTTLALCQCSSQSWQRASTSVMRLSISMPSMRGTVSATTPVSVARNSRASRLPANSSASGITL